MENILTGKTILITGGTSRLGREFIRRAIPQGATIFFTYHTHQDAANSLIQMGASGFQLDLSNFRAIDDFAEWCQTHIRGLDGLIHNAATNRDALLQNMSEKDWDFVLDVDLKAPYYLTQKLLPLLRKDPVSKILMMTSRLAFHGGVGVSNYAAAKAGMIGLMRSLAQELGKKKILVNAVNPGFMKSPMTEPLPGDVIQKNLQASLIGAVSNPEEVADFLIYLLSDRMSQVTGQVFHFESRYLYE
ncbi:MAG: SDR family oxidoreductase [Candidatus Omnitrophica bacterium]|nr:SDR family oxidoreductase [Candidatus Omnitrophota bacterium]